MLLFAKINQKLVRFLLLGLIVSGVGNTFSALIEAANKILPAPTEITVDLINQDQVILLWDRPNDPAITGYTISRTDNPNETPTPIGTASTEESSFIDATVEINKTYSYRISSTSPGYLPGDSEIKSILIKSTEPVVESLPVAKPESGLTSVVSSLGIQLEEKFWPNLLLFNLLVLAFLALIYIPLRAKFKGREPQKTLLLDDTYEHSFKDLDVDLRLGSPDTQIVANADKRYQAKVDKKVKEWIKAAK